jgi:hypothetical protein
MEFTFKNKTEGKRMSATALNKSVIGAIGGAMRGIEGVLLPKDRHGYVDLRGNADTFVSVSDFGPGGQAGADAEIQYGLYYGECLLAALSTHSGRGMLFLHSSQVRAAQQSPSCRRAKKSSDDGQRRRAEYWIINLCFEEYTK